MTESSLISIETRRYSEFFRRVFAEYLDEARVRCDSRFIEGGELAKFAVEWCTNERITHTTDFVFYRAGVELFGFHDHPSELWAAMSELSFIERLATEKLVHFKIMKSRG